MPDSTPKLPFQLLKSASKLFAGEKGMSHGEIVQFFCYELNKRPEEIKPPLANNRSEAFEGWLSYFSVAKQKELLLRLCREPFPMYHGQPPEEERKQLASILMGCAIEETVGKALHEINHTTVEEYWKKALDRRIADPEGAITAARTLVETVCKHILEESGEPCDAGADLPTLYSHTAKRLNLSPSQHTEAEFKQILSGCHSVIHGLGAIRNKIGDAHGKGLVRVKPAPRHAELAVNLAGAMATFLFATWAARKPEAAQIGKK